MQLSPDNASHILLKCPSDIGIRNTDRKSTLKAPEKILNKFDCNNLFVDTVFPDEFNLAENQQRITTRINELLQHNKPIISIGGDHSISYPLIKAFKHKYNSLKLIWIDAHYDLKEIRINNGIPHDAVIRGLLADTSLNLTDIIFCGTREIDFDEETFLQNKQPTTLSIKEIQTNDINHLQNIINRRLAPNTQPVYISFDIDVIDSSHISGTTFPSSGGISPTEAQNLIESLKKYNTVGWDIVEVSPTLQTENTAVDTARKLLTTIIE